MADQIPYADKHIEAKLSTIGAKVVKATEMSFSATKLLQDAQLEIADLYESLGDVLAGQGEEKGQDEAAKPNQSAPPVD